MSLGDFFRPLVRVRSLAAVLLLSIGVQASSAVTSVLIFISIAYPVGLLVNLFVVPIFLFIFLLPISFGSVGVREGSHILLYGLFDVPREVALVASFIGLLGLLLNQAIGAAVIWWCGGVAGTAAPPPEAGARKD